MVEVCDIGWVALRLVRFLFAEFEHVVQLLAFELFGLWCFDCNVFVDD